MNQKAVLNKEVARIYRYDILSARNEVHLALTSRLTEKQWMVYIL